MFKYLNSLGFADLPMSETGILGVQYNCVLFSEHKFEVVQTLICQIRLYSVCK